MESSTGTGGMDKPWDHAWSTEEMRKNRRDWSLAADSGLLKHLQQFSENVTKKTNETQEALNSMTAQLNEAAILVDNITNTSLALANTQFIESRVQEDNIEIEQPAENPVEDEHDQEMSANDLLVSVCESIKEGLKIMDEKYETVEVIASDSEDEDDNGVQSVILRPKDPYQDRPLPYVFGTEQWQASSKVGLESSSSESEQNDEDEDSASDTDDKNIGHILGPSARSALGIGRSSSLSSESNDYNVESSSIKDNDKSRLYARSQDTLNSDTEPTTPSSVLPKSQTNNGPPSFAEELAKRLGSVLPPQRNVIQESDESSVNRSKEDIFAQDDDQDVFSSKSNNLFSEGKNLFSDEDPATSWKNKPVKVVNKNIIPASIDVPPPLTKISSAPKSTIDDLFGDVEDSEDSDDIFPKKGSKDAFADEREALRSEIANKQKNLNVESVQNASVMTTSTPETNDRGKGLFNDEEDDDLFSAAPKQVSKPPDEPLLGSAKKKPIGGVSIFGKVDILSSSKFARRPSSSSSASENEPSEQRSNEPANFPATTEPVNSKSNISNIGTSNISNNGTSGSSLEAGNVGNATTMSNTGSSSGISVRQPSSDNTAGSSLGADFQPLMSSSRLKSEEIYRERVASDSLFASKSQQQQQQRSVPSQDVSEEPEDVFGPPPLPSAADTLKSKSKVTSLFDDSDSDDDLFGSPSLKSSSAPTPSKQQQQPPPKKKGLFDDDDDLFGRRDAPDVDLFGATTASSKPKFTSLFDDEPPDDDGLFGESKSKSKSGSTVSSIFGENKSGDSVVSEKKEEIKKEPEKSVVKEPAKVPEKKPISKGLFDDSDDSDLFSAAPKVTSTKSNVSSGSKGLLDDTDDSDLFGSSTSLRNVLEKNVVEKSSDSLFGDTKEPTDFFTIKKPVEQKLSKPNIGSEDKPKTESVIETKSVASKGPLVEDKPEAAKSDSVFEDKSAALKSDPFFEDKPVAPKSDPLVEDKPKTQKPDTNFEKKPVASKSNPTTEDKPKESKPDSFFAGTAKTSLLENKPKAPKPGSLFEDEPSTDSLFGNKPKTSKPKKLTTSIFDDSDDDEDLFGSSKKKSQSSSSLFEDNKSINVTKVMNDEKKVETEKIKEEKVKEPPKVMRKDSPPSSKLVKKVIDKKNIFDDDDDDDDLFGDKKKKSVVKEEPKDNDEIKKEERSNETKAEPPKKPDLASKKAVFAEIQKKLEKHKLLDPERAPKLTRPDKHEPTVVDGAVSSKKEPPKTLKLKDPPKPPSPTEDSPTNQSASKKPAVSGKIKNLQGKMGALKMLSPTDTPPTWRKSNEEKSANEDDEHTPELPSSDASTPTMPSEASSPHTSGTNSRARDSPSTRSDNTEVAISFDEPAQVETLSSTASKSRVRIPAKRRPQSRQARHSALRHSGIDFDVVDASPTSPQPNGDASDAQIDADRLQPRRTHHSTGDLGHADDKSEISASRNTTTNLLSPSTDEEDLFDVPPDLPEDPAAKEESLFGRAPILSPMEPIEKPRERVYSERREKTKTKENSKGEKEERKEEVTKPVDPLRDESHDPLQDPSQLFAFVTKTPSPEKNKGLLFAEDDDSLFTSSTKGSEKKEQKKSKAGLDLFVDDDDAESDLFSSSKAKMKTKPLKDTKIDLFDDVAVADDDDSLFASSSKKTESTKSKEVAAVEIEVKSKSRIVETEDDSLFGSSSKKTESTKSKEVAAVEIEVKSKSRIVETEDDSLFGSSAKTIEKKEVKDMSVKAKEVKTETLKDDDDSLFGASAKKTEGAKKDAPVPEAAAEKSETKSSKTAMKDIFDNSSDEDLFASSKKTIPKKKTTSLFDDDDDDDDLFGKPKTSMKESKSAANTDRPVVKKAVTKDLKKTAEKIVEDPLSMLRDD